jgi:hypothetical protein
LEDFEMGLTSNSANKKLSDLSTSERRTLIDQLSASMAELSYDLAAAGRTDLVRTMLDVKIMLGAMSDDIARGKASYSEEIISEAVRLIKTTATLLQGEHQVMTTH